MKKIFSLMLLVLTSSAIAGGIKGRVTDEYGNVRKGVVIKAGGYSQTTKTNGSGDYWLELPASAERTRVNVYVKGKLAANCLVPAGDQYATVNVVIEKR
jgi:hypothetical protein